MRRPKQTTTDSEKRQPDHGYAGLRRGHEMEDSAQTRSWGTKLRSAYLRIVGDSPQLKPDDRAGARKHLSRIDTAIMHGGWTRGEWRRLHAMRQKWAARLDGEDARFKLYGTMQGGLTRHQQNEVDLHKTINKVKKGLLNGAR